MTAAINKLDEAKDMDEDGQRKVAIISRLRNDFGLLLVIIRYVVFIFITIILLGTVILSVLAWLSSASLGDRAAELGAIFAGITLLLTMFAAVVAYIAFSVSFGFPDLDIRISFGSSSSERLTILAERKNERLEAKDDLTQTELAICLRNVGRYPAKELAIIVQLDGMEFMPDVTALAAAGWTVNERSDTGVRAVQWDGGAGCTVPSGFIRELPELNLLSLRTIPDGIGGMWMKGYSRRRYRRFIRSQRKSAAGEPSEALIVVSMREAASRMVIWRPVYFIVDGKS
jgi:hypothetical protein